MVSSPANPSSRRVSAARIPASDAPTMTIRPSLRSRSICGRFVLVIEEDGLHWAGSDRPPEALPLMLMDQRGIHQSFLAMYFEHVRGEESALRVALAAVEVDDDLHRHGSQASSLPSHDRSEQSIREKPLKPGRRDLMATASS